MEKMQIKCNSSILLLARIDGDIKIRPYKQSDCTRMWAVMSVTSGLIFVRKATRKLDMTEEILNVKLLLYSSKGEDVNDMMDALMQFKAAQKKKSSG